MSGICGIVADGSPIEPGVLESMIAAARHRAVRGSASYEGDGVAIGHLEDGILPEFVRSRQPLAVDGLVVAADARLDNGAELRTQLQRSGHLAGGAVGDADILLAGFRRWGDDVCRHLVGDYAFVIWDQARRRLVAARDPMAMRALYYRAEPGPFLFATELKQILAVPGVAVDLFEPAVGAHLVGSFPLAHTSYRGIRSLPAGHLLVHESGRTTIRPFWTWEVEPAPVGSEDEYASLLLEVLLGAVRSRLRATGDFGILLSGGMDSGSVAAAAGSILQSASGPTLRAYSFSFPTMTDLDERSVSSIIADRYALPTTDIDAERHHPLSGYPLHGPDRDEPYLGVYQPAIETALDAAAHDGVRLMLGGDRGDLAIGGFGASVLGLLAGGRPADARHELDRLARLSGRSRLSIGVDYILKPAVRALRRAGPTGVLRRLRRPTGSGPSLPAPPWVPPELAEAARSVVEETPHRPMPDHDPWVGRRLELLLEPMHLRGVVWSERTYARAGIGFVDPFSDVRLARLVLSLPQLALNRPGGPDKRLLRLAMRGVTPAAAIERARKVSPHPLWYASLRTRAAPAVAGLLQDMRAENAGFVDGGALRAHYETVRSGAVPHPFFWWALTLEMWLRAHWE